MRKGTKHSEESKVKIAAAKQGKTFTSEHSAAISAALKGQKKSAAHRRKIGLGIKAAYARKKDAIENAEETKFVPPTNEVVA